jgi:DNA gyrase/topoisomerase IV subunit B
MKEAPKAAMTAWWARAYKGLGEMEEEEEEEEVVQETRSLFTTSWALSPMR